MFVLTNLHLKTMCGFKFLEIMKKLLLFLSIAFVMSCSENDIQNDEMTKHIEGQNETGFANRGFEIDTTFFVTEAKKAMASFVSEVGTYYHSGDTYQDLKESLDPTNQLSDITTTGDDLLFQAFKYLEDDIDESQMSGELIMVALNEILVRADTMGIKSLDNVDLEEGSTWLFGVDESLLNRGGCRWYQLGCHASSIWNWFTSTANGGGTTNGQALSWAVGIIVALIALMND